MERRWHCKINKEVISNVPITGLGQSDVKDFIFLCATFADWPKSLKKLYQRIMSCFWFETQYQIGKISQPLVEKKSFLLSGYEINI